MHVVLIDLIDGDLWLGLRTRTNFFEELKGLLQLVVEVRSRVERAEVKGAAEDIAFGRGRASTEACSTDKLAEGARIPNHQESEKKRGVRDACFGLLLEYGVLEGDGLGNL